MTTVTRTRRRFRTLLFLGVGVAAAALALVAYGLHALRGTELASVDLRFEVRGTSSMTNHSTISVCVRRSAGPCTPSSSTDCVGTGRR